MGGGHRLDDLRRNLMKGAIEQSLKRTDKHYNYDGTTHSVQTLIDTWDYITDGWKSKSLKSRKTVCLSISCKEADCRGQAFPQVVLVLSDKQGLCPDSCVA